MNFNLGERGIISAEFRSVDDSALVDPTTVRAKVYSPQGTLTTYTYGVGIVITKAGVGEYSMELLLDIPGNWTVRFEGTGSNEAADQIMLYADASPFYDPMGEEYPDS